MGPQALSGFMGGRSIVVPMTDPEQAAQFIVEVHQTTPFDGIVSVDEQALRAAALASERLGLRHVSTSAARLSQNKASMRSRIAEGQVRQPKFIVVETDTDVSVAAAKFRGPVVVKPSALSGSTGVIRVDSRHRIQAAVALVRSIQADHGCGPETPVIIEEYIDGAEFAVEAIVAGGNLLVLAVFEKPEPLTGPFFAETIYITPPSLPEEKIVELTEVLDSARKQLGIDTGPVHAEFRMTAPGDFVFIELAARSIGGRCSKAVPFAGGISLESLILTVAIGAEMPEAKLEHQASGVYMIPAHREGRLGKISGIDRALSIGWITGVDITAGQGEFVRPIPYDSQYLGFIFAKAPSARLVHEALVKAFDQIEMEITP